MIAVPNFPRVPDSLPPKLNNALHGLGNLKTNSSKKDKRSGKSFDFSRYVVVRTNLQQSLLF